MYGSIDKRSQQNQRGTHWQLNKSMKGPATMNRTAVRIGSETQDIKLAGNKIQGFSTEVADQRK